MYPWSIQSLGSFLGIISSKLLTSLVQSIMNCLNISCSQNLRVHVSKGTCSHDQVLLLGFGRAARGERDMQCEAKAKGEEPKEEEKKEEEPAPMEVEEKSSSRSSG